MFEIPCRCYKIAHKLPLEKICTFLALQKPVQWKDVVFLDDSQLQNIIKDKGNGTGIYMFRSGCVAFIGYSEGQARMVLEFLSSFLDHKYDSIFYKYHEEHILQIQQDKRCKLHAKSELYVLFDDQITQMIALVLAKSVELQWFENIINCLLDETEHYIKKLHLGKVKLNRRQFKRTILKVIRFELESASSIKFFDKEFPYQNSLRANPVLRELSLHYELFERLETIEEKLWDLKKFMKSYREQAMRKEQRRIYIYELLFLAMFPIAGLIRKSFHGE